MRMTLCGSPKLLGMNQFGGGGADGLIMKFSAIEETTLRMCEGIEEILEDEQKLALKCGVTFTDIIQFSAAVSATPDGQVPEAFDMADTTLARVTDAGLISDELVDLLVSHIIMGIQQHVDPVCFCHSAPPNI
ncbi:hypothetical protein B0H10DRAFT_2218746 [Mycena sp. CBHHK59/15]|nr:hypothetical protein B0H10DRAFT_2218746 [Mycena sp. CBHHK59/15]